MKIKILLILIFLFGCAYKASESKANRSCYYLINSDFYGGGIKCEEKLYDSTSRDMVLYRCNHDVEEVHNAVNAIKKCN